MTSDELRTLSARDHALRRYAEAHDRFSELEQRYMLAGREVEAAGCHAYALILLRAYRGELDNPQPRGTVE